MADSRFRVLSVSKDPRLLMTREPLIRSLGLHVTSSLARFAPDWLQREQYHLLVLGHSVELDLARDLGTLARKQSPDIHIILLRRTAYSVVRCEFADTVCLPDPPVLLEAISHLLGLEGGRRQPAASTRTKEGPSPEMEIGHNSGYPDRYPDVIS